MLRVIALIALALFCASCAGPSVKPAGTDVVSSIKEGLKASAENRDADAVALLSAAIASGRSTSDPQIVSAVTVAYRFRAYSYEILYQFDKAIADYSEAIRRSPRSADTYADRGLIYAEIQRFDKASADYGTALRIDPKNKVAYTLRADTARLKGQWNAALQDAAKAISLDPNYWRAYQVRGRVYQGKKEYAKAIHDFEQTIRLRPSFVMAYLARADSIYSTRDYERAAKAYQELLRRFPQSDRSHYAIAWFRASCPADRLRNGKEAVLEATKACEMVQWRDWSNIEALAIAYAEVGEFDRAIKYLNRAIQVAGPEATSQDKTALRNLAKLFTARKPYRDHS